VKIPTVCITVARNRASRNSSHNTQNNHLATLLTNAAAHLAQSRLLLRRAIPGLSPGDAAELQRVGDALHAVVFLLEAKGRRCS
jgi:hypothetical protein